MNVAVEPDHRGRGIATLLLERLFELTADDERRGYTLEVRVSNAVAIAPLRAARVRSAGRPPRLLHRQPRGRADHVEGPGRPRADVILGIETSCDETAAALVTRRRHIRSNVVSSQADLHARFGGVVPEIASRRHLELSRPSCARRSAKRVRRSTTSTGRRHAGPGPDRCAARRSGRGQGDRVVAAPAARAGRPSARPRRVALSRADPLEPPFLCLLASGGHTLLLDVRGYDDEHGARDDARRRGGGGVRQGRAAARPRLSGRPRDRPARAATATPRAYDFPVARVPGLDFSFSGLKTALLYAMRDLPRGRARRAPRRSRRELPARDRPRARRAASRGGRRLGADRGRRRRRGELRAARRAARSRARAALRSAPTTPR